MTDTKQIEKLANFIIADVPGEPSRDEGAVDTAIRIIRKHLSQQAAVKRLVGAAKLLRSEAIGKLVCDDVIDELDAALDAVEDVMGMSSCCSAPMQVVGKTTKHYECTACGKSCDPKEDTE